VAAVSGCHTRSLALYLIAGIVVIGTATAFVQSYEGLHGWASRYLSEGWALTWPLQVDAWIAVGELALYVAYRDGWSARRRVWPWLAALSGLAVSTGFNIGHLAGADLAGRLTAAVPPVAAFGGLFLGLQVLKHVESDRPGPTHRGWTAGHVAAAVWLAALTVAAERRCTNRQPMVSDGRGSVYGRRRLALPPNSGGSGAVVGGSRGETRNDAARIVASVPGITGAELARRLGVSERTGRRLIRRLSS
jgi:hypothetical protein